MKLRHILIAVISSFMFLTGCGNTMPNSGGNTTHEHSFKTTWSKDDTYHWHDCTGCDEVSDKAKHTFVDTIVEPTTSKGGYTEHKCTVCNYSYKDNQTDPIKINKYTITWKNYDGTILEVDRNVEEGTLPTYEGSTPTRNADAEFSYTFKGWDPEVVPATSDATYTATFNETRNRYTITWKNYNGDVLATESYEYGATPVYKGETPIKPSTIQYTYTFSGWDHEIETVTKNDTYIATFTDSIATYTVTWTNYDGTILATETYQYGDLPSYKGDTPTKEIDGSSTYNFVGWSPNISRVVSDATYVATFESVLMTYTVTWLNYDGSVLDTETYQVGETPYYKGNAPKKPSDDSNSYVFSGWSPEIETVTGDKSYTALFDATVRKYTVSFVNYNGVVLEEHDYEYGEMPSYSGNTPVRRSDAQYTYTFIGWDKEVVAVTGDVTYTATYDSTIRTYTVTWTNYDGTVLATETYEFGEMPEYKGETPTKDLGNGVDYEFVEWAGQIQTVTEDATYRAVFNDEVTSFTVIWYNYDGTILLSEEYAFGETPSFKGNEPSRVSTAQYTYTFNGWDKELKPITNNTEFYACYSENIRSYTVTWADYDGTVLETETYEYGDYPVYKWEDPTRDSTISTVYTFDGWDKEIVAVDGDITYFASYSSSAAVYTVTWLDEDGTILLVSEEEYGNYPIFNDTDSLQHFDQLYCYVFNGWDKEIEWVDADITYTATYVKYNIYQYVYYNQYNGYFITTVNYNIKDLNIPSYYDGRPIVGIGDNAFSYRVFNSVTIPDTIVRIGSYAFYESQGFDEIVIPDSVTYIGEYAFHCSAESIIVSRNIQTLGYDVFGTCDDIYYYGDISHWNDLGNKGFLYTENSVHLFYNNEEVTVLNTSLFGITVINIYAFAQCKSLKEIHVGNDVTMIGFSAFYHCDGLESITLPFIGESVNSSYKHFGYIFGASEGYSSSNYVPKHLTLVKLVENPNYTSIDYSVFQDCYYIARLEIPSTITNVDSSAISYAYRLVEIINHSNLDLSYLLNNSNNNLKNIVNDIGESKIIINDGYVIYQDNDYVSLINYIGDDTDLVLPNNITEINAYALSYSQITSIDIPNSVTAIGKYAFYQCYNIESIIVPDSVVSIGMSAFSDCTGLTSIALPNNLTSIAQSLFARDCNLASIEIPSTVSSIGSAAFWYCTSLSSIAIPYGVTTINESTFCGCTNLELVILPNTITSINEGAFAECYNLKTINLPNTITYIGNGAFEVSALEFNEYENGLYLGNEINPYLYLFGVKDNSISEFTISDGCIIIINSALSNCSNISSLDIPSSVLYIGDNAFQNCSSLENIYFHDGLLSIGQQAFQNCSSLKSVTIPNTVTYIGNLVFNYCDSLESISVPFLGNENGQLGDIFYNTTESLKTVAITGNCTVLSNGAFNGYSYIENISLPEGLLSIGNFAFYKCNALTSISISSTVTSIGNYAFYECESLVTITLPSSVLSIGEYAFFKCTNLEHVNGGSGLTNIGSFAFQHCSSLLSFTFPSGVKTINGYIFSGCTSLATLTISEGCEIIENSAFVGLTALKSLVIPDTVRYIGQFALQDCSSLEYLYLPVFTENQNSNLQYFGYIFGAYSPESQYSYVPTSLKTVEISSNCVLIPNYAFYGLTNISTIILPDTIATIGQYAFYNCTSLYNIELTENIDQIGQYAFGYCSSLKEITIPSRVNEISLYAFYYCSGLETINISNGVETICDGAFYYCESIASIVIPSSVTYIERGAFSGCNNLKEITIPFVGNRVNGDYTFLGYIFGSSNYYDYNQIVSQIETINFSSNITSIPNCAFYNCTSLKTINIPETVDYIGNSAFYNCSSLESITLPNNISSISSGMFYDCISLSNIYIPNGVTNIYSNAFYNCSNLTSITLPNNLQYIGENAFYNCELLTSITVPNTVTRIGFGAFSYCSSIEEIYLPFIGEAIDSGNHNFGYIFGADSYSWQSNYIPNSLKRVTIYDGMTTISYRDFHQCQHLEEINLPSTINAIEQEAFYYCTSLKSINIPEGVEIIDQRTFYYCPSLTSMTLPSSVYSIEQEAFSQCFGLTTINIPENVVSIGNNAFLCCYRLVEIVNKSSLGLYRGSTSFGRIAENALQIINDESKSKLSIDENGFVIYHDGDKYYLIDYLGDEVDITLPNSITIINSYAFYQLNNIHTVTLNNGVKEILSNAFYECGSLQYNEDDNDLQYLGSSDNPYFWLMRVKPDTSRMKYEVHEGCKYINYGAFSGREDIVSITLPSTLIDIEDFAFNSCNYLVEIINKSSLELQYNSAAYGDLTYYAKQIIADESESTLEIRNNEFVIIEDTNGDVYLVKYIGNNGNVTLPEDVDVISSYAFKYSIMSSINLGNNLSDIEQYAFYNCENLGVVNIPSSVTHISVGAFCFCYAIETVTIPFIGCTRDDLNGNNLESIFTGGSANNIRRVTILEGPNAIRSNSFYGLSDLEDLIIPNSVTYIEEGAFGYCDNLHYNTFDNGLYLGNNSNPYMILVKAVDNTVSSFNFNPNCKIIYAYALRGCGSLTSITIPESIIYIGIGAFNECSSLESITLPFIGNGSNNGKTHFSYIFGAEYYSDTQNYVPSSLKTVVITNNITEVPSCAFYYCSNLTSITLPTSVQMVNNYAFSHCTSLVDINGLGDEVIQIASYAFEYCSSLENFAIPNYVTIIGEHAFAGCSSLTSIVVPYTVASIGSGAFYNCTSLVDITIPFIGESEDCQNNTYFGHIFGFAGGGQSEGGIPVSLRTVTISRGTFIPDMAFSYCYYLTSINIPNTITSIGSEAFYCCQSLTSFIIPSGVTSIGDYAFCSCSNISSMTIPSSVTSIGLGTFRYCSSLEEITLPFIGQSLNDNTFLGYIFGTTDRSGSYDYVPQSLKTVTVNGNITTVPEYAFYFCQNIETINLPNSVTAIGNYAFCYCNHLTSANIPDGVLTIGQGAFQNCSSITSIVIPNSVTSIGTYAFFYCDSLESLSLPSLYDKYLSYFFGLNDKTSLSVYVPLSLKTVIITGECTIIPEYAFSNCQGIETIILPNTIETIERCAFWNCDSLITFNMPSGVTSIGSSAFADSESLTTISLPSGITEIPNSAFYGCSSLQSITILGELTSIGDNAFFGCSSLLSIIIPDTVDTIGNSAFNGCINLSSIHLPSGITTIPIYLFRNCSSLTSITIPDGVTTIEELAFEGCSGIESLVIPSSVTDAQAGCLIGISSLKTLTIMCTDNFPSIFSLYRGNINNIPATLSTIIIGEDSTIIGRDFFQYCSFLTSIDIPNGITSIGFNAFNACTSLVSVNIPESVIEIGDYAFSGCTSLETFEIPSTVTSVGHSVFSGCSALESITLSLASLPADDYPFARLFTPWNDTSFIPASLTEVNITGGTVVQNNMFNSCYNIETINLPNTITAIGNYAFYNCFAITCFTIPSGVISIGDYAFSGTSIESIVVPTSVTSIGCGAFNNCQQLESITVPFIGNSEVKKRYMGYIFGANSYYDTINIQMDSLKTISFNKELTSIPDYAFYGFNKLPSFEIPNTVTSIGTYAFYGCKSLTSIEIPESVEVIHDDAFVECIYLVEVINKSTHFTVTKGATSNGWVGYYAINVTNVLDRDRFIYDYDGFILYDYEDSIYLVKYIADDVDVVVPNVVNIINDRAFDNRKDIKTVQLPDSVTYIGRNAFYFCTSLRSINLPNGLTQIGDAAFMYCRSLTSITLPQGLQVIGNGAFQECSKLVEVVDKAPNIDVYIGSDFNGYVGYYALQVITDEADSKIETDTAGFVLYRDTSEVYLLDYLGEEESITFPDDVTIIRNYAFYQNSVVKSIVASPNLKHIGDYAFNYCTELTSITLPDTVTYIGYHAFASCSSLESITIPGGVNEIKAYTFNACVELTSVIISSGVTSLDAYAFFSCANLESVTLPNTVVSIGSLAFTYCYVLTDIYFDGTIEEWKSIHTDYSFELKTIHCTDGSFTVPEGLYQ